MKNSLAVLKSYVDLWGTDATSMGFVLSVTAHVFNHQ